MSNKSAEVKQAGSGGVIASIKQTLGSMADALEPVVEIFIRLCGWSAIVFVLAIFAFVFGQAFLVHSAEDGISIWSKNFLEAWRSFYDIGDRNVYLRNCSHLWQSRSSDFTSQHPSHHSSII